MSYLGNTKIGGIYLGTTSIGKAYLGNDLVFQKGGGQLPSGYTPIEYVENQGGARIDTGITGESAWTFTAQALATASSNRVLIADESSATGGHYLGTIASQSNKWGAGSSAGYYVNVVCTTKSDIVVSFDSNKNISGTVNGSSFSRSGTEITPEGVSFFSPPGGTSYNLAGRLYGNVVCTKNGAVVFNGIPCINTSNQVGLYDTVSSTFITSATSTALVAGPNV